MKKKILASVLLAGATLLTACSGDAGDTESSAPVASDELTPVTLGVVPIAAFAPVYVAQESGYFEDEGLDVDIEFLQSGNDAIPVLASGQMDALAAGYSAGVFSALESGLEFKIVGSMGISEGDDYAPAHLLVREELSESGDVSDAGDLEGKTIAVAGGEAGTGAYMTAVALEEEGLTLDDVELVNLANPDMAAALESGSVDAALIAAPFSENALKDNLGVSLWHPPEGFSTTGLMYGEEFLDSDESQALFNALVRAAADLQGDDRYQEEILEQIAAGMDQPVSALEDTPLYGADRYLYPYTDEFQNMERVWMEAGSLTYEDPLDQDDYVDTSFADAAKKN